MVHALDEIERTLKPGGALIDLRPLADHWTVEVSTSVDFKTAGYLTDMPAGLADDEAANRAMQEAETRGWFARKHSEEFSFFYYWDTPSEMKEFMETEWDDFEKMEEDVYRKATSLWASANADARVRVRVKMSITQWEKWWS